MKKFIVLLFIFLLNIINTFGIGVGHSGHFLDNYDIRWQSGNIGLELNFQHNSSIVFADFFNIRFKHNHTRIGLEFTPVRVLNIFHDGGDLEPITNISFLNFAIFWNTINFTFQNDSLNFFIGPFNRINYIYLYENNTFNLHRFVYTAGFRLGLVLQHGGNNVNFWNRVSMNIISAEMGFRNITGANTFYVNVNTDFIMILAVLIGAAWRNNE